MASPPHAKLILPWLGSQRIGWWYFLHQT